MDSSLSDRGFDNVVVAGRMAADGVDGRLPASVEGVGFDVAGEGMSRRSFDRRDNVGGGMLGQRRVAAVAVVVERWKRDNLSTRIDSFGD